LIKLQRLISTGW